MFLQGFLLIIQQELSLQVELLLKDELLRCLREEKCSLFLFHGKLHSTPSRLLCGEILFKASALFSLLP